MKLSKAVQIEAVLHVLFWLLIFSAVNVNWTADWFDKTIRPTTPPPLSVLIFPFVFYLHAFGAIPNYLNLKKWKTYTLCFLLIFIVPELVRSGVFVLMYETTFWGEISSRDSFLLGQPSVLGMGVTFSFAYRFSKDWFIRQHQIEKLGMQLSHQPKARIPENQPLGVEEAEPLRQRLEVALHQEKPYLDQDLSLAELAKMVGTSDKKLSTLLNQNMHTNFYDYINSFRIVAFKAGVAEGKLEQFSIVGLALQCGFKSKSSFYRAFKKETGLSPSQFNP
jgi:AraC-like DNA-binding protein